MRSDRMADGLERKCGWSVLPIRLNGGPRYFLLGQKK